MGIKETINKNKLLILVSIVLFLTPFLIWGNNFRVGGDDTKLYYVFPDAFLKNYAFNVASDNTLGGATTGYAPVSYFAPFFYIIKFLDTFPYLNVQMMMLGLNLTLGFVFFYKLLILLEKKLDVIDNSPFLIGSLMYVLSPFLINTLYSHQLISVYLVSIIPSTLYFFSKSVLIKDIKLTIVSALIFSIFSTTLNTFPWWSAFLITSVPFFLYLLFNKTKETLFYGMFFCVISLILNLHWIFHLVFSLVQSIGSNSILEYYSSTEFLVDNIRVARGVSTLYNPLNIIFFRMDSATPYNLGIFELLNISFVSLIVISLVSRKYKKTNAIFPFVVSSFLLSWYLFSPNIGDWGADLFVIFSQKIPYFTAYRNMFDKFSLSVAFFFAMAFSYALKNTSENKHNIKPYLYIFFSVLLIINILNAGKKLLVKSEHYSVFSGEFNKDYLDLINYFNGNRNYSRIVWLPLNFPTYANVYDSRGSIYSGLSPMRILSDRTDLVGKFSFINSYDLFLGDEIFNYLKDHSYEDVGNVFKKLGVGYVVINNLNLTNESSSFMYGGDEQPLLKYQNDDFYSDILGEKITDFGKTYSLYYISTKYKSDKIYGIDDFGNYVPINYIKVSSNEYLVQPTNDMSKLVFSEPFSENWYLDIKESKNIVGSKFQDYSIVWDLSEQLNTNTIVRIKFGPAKYNSTLYNFTVVTYVFLVTISLVWLTKKK